MKLKIWGYEIIVQKAYFSNLHITDNMSSIPEEKPYVHDFNHAKRLNALIRKHGMVEFTFRDIDSAISEYGPDVIQLLEGVLEGYGKIRNALIISKMPKEMLEKYDNKIYSCHDKLITILENRGDTPNAKILRDYPIDVILKGYV